MVLRRFKVREHERGLMFRDREFARVLRPGVHWAWDPLFKVRVDLVSVRTAWHAPADLSPGGHAANAHLDLASLNFGIQEGCVVHGDAIREVFPGTPVIRDGYLYINEGPGFGVDLNEAAAARFPCDLTDGNWGPRRSANGSIVGN